MSLTRFICNNAVALYMYVEKLQKSHDTHYIKTVVFNMDMNKPRALMITNYTHAFREDAQGPRVPDLGLG